MPDQLARGADDIVELRKGTDEQGVSRRGFRLVSAVGHELSAARLVERDFDAEALQKRRRRYPNLRMEGIDVAGTKRPTRMALSFWVLDQRYSALGLTLPLKTMKTMMV
jgi:hypothetical protein